MSALPDVNRPADLQRRRNAWTLLAFPDRRIYLSRPVTARSVTIPGTADKLPGLPLIGPTLPGRLCGDPGAGRVDVSAFAMTTYFQRESPPRASTAMSWGTLPVWPRSRAWF